MDLWKAYMTQCREELARRLVGKVSVSWEQMIDMLLYMYSEYHHNVSESCIILVI